jgi:hypothetical protein
MFSYSRQELDLVYIYYKTVWYDENTGEWQASLERRKP